MSESKTKLRIFKIIIIILIIYIVLFLTKCTVTKEQYVTKQVPFDSTETIEQATRSCIEKEYEWENEWGQWQQEEDQKTSISFSFTNLEDRSGTFLIDFAFFDNSILPFEGFRGGENVPWEFASIWVRNNPVLIGPNEKILMIPSIPKENPDSTYWAIANITAPKYEQCTFENQFVDRNKTTMVDKKVKENVTKTLSLWELLLNKE